MRKNKIRSLAKPPSRNITKQKQEHGILTQVGDEEKKEMLSWWEGYVFVVILGSISKWFVAVVVVVATQVHEKRLREDDAERIWVNSLNVIR